jgi:hypothetical protein
LADGNRFFNRSGTSIVETVEIIAEILHGHRVGTGWRGKAWEPFCLAASQARPLRGNYDRAAYYSLSRYPGRGPG